MSSIQHKLYSELAQWWPLLSDPAEYEEEAEFFQAQLLHAYADHNPSGAPPTTLLELGSGGGNNASFLKHTFEMTLVDLSEEMLAVSRALNPSCTHIQGDMQSIRLAQQFDCVFVHDAIDYMTTPESLKAALQTIWHHVKPGGVALIAPDDLKENFSPSTSHGGHDGGADSAYRALRYLSWVTDPDPTDTSVVVDYMCMLHTPDGQTETFYERHLCGLFARQSWIEWLTALGFEVDSALVEHSDVTPESWEVFVVRKPGDSR